MHIFKNIFTKSLNMNTKESLTHDVIADSNNNIIERENFEGHKERVKILNKVDFLNSLTTH